MKEGFTDSDYDFFPILETESACYCKSSEAFHHEMFNVEEEGNAAPSLLFLPLNKPVLPGGRNFGQKAQKGVPEKKVGRKNLWPNFG